MLRQAITLTAMAFALGACATGVGVIDDMTGASTQNRAATVGGGPLYDARGNVVYSGGPLYDARGNLVYGAPTARQPVSSYPSAGGSVSYPIANDAYIGAPTTATSAYPTVAAAPLPPAPSAYPTSGDGPRFDANGNLISDNSIIAPDFDASGNIITPGAAAPYETAALSQPVMTQAAPAPMAAPQAAPQTAPMMAGAGGSMSLAGTSWRVSMVQGARAPENMMMHFVPVNGQNMAIVDSPCGQATGVYTGGSGGALSVSGVNGCAQDGGLGAALGSVNGYRVDAGLTNMELISGGRTVATLSSL